MNIYKLEFFKLKYVFCSLFIIELLLDILALTGILHVENGIDTIYSFWQMISWLFLVGYCIWDFYNFFYLGRDIMLVLNPRTKDKIMRSKALVYFGFMLLYFAVELVRYAILLPVGESIVKICAIYIISKMASIVSFLSLLIFLLYVTKNISQRYISFLLMAVLGGAIVVFQTYFICQNILSHNDVTWIVGVVDGTKGINSFANILPIVFMGKGDKTNIVDSFYAITFVSNLIIAAVLYVASKIIYKNVKYDYTIM